MNSTDHPTRTHLRSFVLRQGRITAAQHAALASLWPVYGVDSTDVFKPVETFGRAAPLILEIGFGNGESLAQMADRERDKDFLGIEVHRPGVGHLLLKAQALDLRNLRVYCADAVDVLRDRMVPGSLDGVQVFFPDPWHKKRHHKRRLVNPAFVALVAERLKPGGFLHCATDWEDYALQMLAVLQASPLLRNQADGGTYAERPASRPLTKFEARGQRLGHGVWDLVFARQ
jgi:tRNA (guanine-N7-)-methyltransferase